MSKTFIEVVNVKIIPMSIALFLAQVATFELMELKDLIIFVT
jgi:hypothetical protein